jgi:hypothetical protein
MSFTFVSSNGVHRRLVFTAPPHFSGNVAIAVSSSMQRIVVREFVTVLAVEFIYICYFLYYNSLLAAGFILPLLCRIYHNIGIIPPI